MDKNALGDRGESIFYVVITEFHGATPLFRPAGLGGKWPLTDYIVELVDHPGMFFLVQVKAGKRGYTKAGRLQISAKKDRIGALLSFPALAYLVAIDEPGGEAYIVRPSSRRSLSSTSTSHSLKNPKVRLTLRDEVFEFWNTVNAAKLAANSAFLD